MRELQLIRMLTEACDCALWILDRLVERGSWGQGLAEWQQILQARQQAQSYLDTYSHPTLN